MSRRIRAFASTPPALRKSRRSAKHVPTSSITPAWRVLPLVDSTLLLSQTLPTGQAFRWRSTGTHPHPSSPTGNAQEWAGTIQNNLYLLRQSPPHATIWYSAHPFSPTAHQILADYLRASDDFRARFEACCHDPAFRRIYPNFSGVRVLRQPPLECLLSFICSSNNNIKRISSMVQHLESHGPTIATYSGLDFHAFPNVETLATISEDDLRAAGFGYRAKFIALTVKQLIAKAAEEQTSVDQMLLSWRALSRDEVIQNLIKFEGVGRKVASCVALMSMDQLGEVPVDTHVWKIAKRYIPQLTGKTLTERVHDSIGAFFRERFGEDFAGVAHSVLFVAEVENKGVMEECVGRDGGDSHIEEENRDDKEPSKVRKKERKDGVNNSLKGVYKKAKRKSVLGKKPRDFEPTPAPRAIVGDGK